MKHRLAMAVAGIALLCGAAPAPVFPTEAELRARYAVPTSQFAEIDGETVHFTIEGKGPAILLLHGSFASLRQWQPWIETLRRHYTVVRYDQSPLGLSGPSPTLDYSIEHRIRVIDRLMDKAGAKRFVIVGTSSAGVITAAYAAARPDRIEGMVLNNIATGPVQVDRTRQPAALKAAIAEDASHPDWHTEEFWRQILLYNVEDKRTITPALVTEWTELNNRMLQSPGAARAAALSSLADRTPGDLEKINAPSLLLWSAQDHETQLDREGAHALAKLASKDKALVAI